VKLGPRRWIGTVVGLVLGAAAVTCLASAGREQFHAPGPMNTQHGDLACESCHRPAPGTLRQQLQNVVRHWLGREAVAVDVGYRAVTNDQCLACHDRPDDRHPVFRFLEPRFAEARSRLHPELCSSCHREHHGVRVTLPETTYCQTCHADLTIDGDPLDVSHRELVATRRWDTCLGCHDFHGNHAMTAPHRLRDAIPRDQIQTYFDGGPSPYPAPVRRASHAEVKTL
jgi:hypothetical protein